MKFTEDDIKDKDRLKKMVRKEALQIFSNPSSRNGRDLETIEFFVKQGKIAELYLIENYQYEEADRKYHDLKDQDGDYTEVKAYNNTTASRVPYVEKDLVRYRNAAWNISKWYMLFNVEEGVYEFIEKIRIK
jgi:hypothetical protein